MTPGGAERVAATLANAWAEQGHVVTVVLTFSGQASTFYAISSSVRVLHLSAIARSTGKGVASYWKRFKALRNLARAEAPDAVVSFLVKGNIAVLLATLGLGLHVIVSERSNPVGLQIGPMWSVLRRLLYPQAARVVMQTSDGLAWLESHIPSAKGVVIPNPVAFPLPSAQPTVRHEALLESGARLLLAAGRFAPEKQFHLLVDCFARLAPRNPTWIVAILGDGASRPRLQEQVRTLGLGSRILMPGQVGNMCDWYERADLFVSTSRLEGFPNTLLEALAYGCPVISYDCPTGTREIIQHEYNGLLVRPIGDVSRMTDALERLMRDEAERQRLAVRSVEVRERYSIMRITSMWEDLLAEVPAVQRAA